MIQKLIVKEIWQAKNCGSLLFVEVDDSKVAYDYNNGDNIEDGIVHKGLPFRFYRPQIDDNSQYSGKNIESQKIHWSLSFFDNVTDMLKKDTVMAMPIENVSQGFMPVALGTNAPTTKEANKIFAPSKKKSETIYSLSLSNIQRKFTIQSAICQDKERRRMMALSPMVLERSLSAATPNCRPGLSLAYSAAQDSLPHDGINPLGFHQSEWRKVCELNVGDEIAVSKSGVFMSGMAYYPIMDKHYKNYKTKSAKDTQHNNHFSSPFSTTRIKNNIIRDANNAQNMSFCGNDNLAKNSPAKYPATIILEKSPTSFAIFSLDFGLSYFIYAIKHITEFIACQAGLLGQKAYADVAVPIKGINPLGFHSEDSCRPGLNLAYSAAQNSLPHDGVADFSLRSNKRAINCATPERELNPVPNFTTASNGAMRYASKIWNGVKFATPYAMLQSNDVVKREL